MDVAGEGVSYKALVARFRTAPPAPRGERASVAARQSGLTSSTVSHASRGEGGELPAWLSSIVASTASVGSDASRTERDNASVRLSSTAAQPTPAPVAPTIAALDATADRSMPSSSGAYVPPARPALRWAAVTPAEQAPPTPTPEAIIGSIFEQLLAPSHSAAMQPASQALTATTHSGASTWMSSSGMPWGSSVRSVPRIVADLYEPVSVPSFGLPSSASVVAADLETALAPFRRLYHADTLPKPSLPGDSSAGTRADSVPPNARASGSKNSVDEVLDNGGTPMAGAAGKPPLRGVRRSFRSSTTSIPLAGDHKPTSVLAVDDTSEAARDGGQQLPAPTLVDAPAPADATKSVDEGGTTGIPPAVNNDTSKSETAVATSAPSNADDAARAATAPTAITAPDVGTRVPAPDVTPTMVPTPACASSPSAASVSATLPALATSVAPCGGDGVGESATTADAALVPARVVLDTTVPPALAHATLSEVVERIERELENTLKLVGRGDGRTSHGARQTSGATVAHALPVEHHSPPSNDAAFDMAAVTRAQDALRRSISALRDSIQAVSVPPTAPSTSGALGVSPLATESAASVPVPHAHAAPDSTIAPSPRSLAVSTRAQDSAGSMLPHKPNVQSLLQELDQLRALERVLDDAVSGSWSEAAPGQLASADARSQGEDQVTAAADVLLSQLQTLRDIRRALVRAQLQAAEQSLVRGPAASMPPAASGDTGKAVPAPRTPAPLASRVLPVSPTPHWRYMSSLRSNSVASPDVHEHGSTAHLPPSTPSSSRATRLSLPGEPNRPVAAAGRQQDARSDKQSGDVVPPAAPAASAAAPTVASSATNPALPLVHDAPTVATNRDAAVISAAPTSEPVPDAGPEQAAAVVVALTNDAASIFSVDSLSGESDAVNTLAPVQQPGAALVGVGEAAAAGVGATTTVAPGGAVPAAGRAPWAGDAASSFIPLTSFMPPLTKPGSVFPLALQAATTAMSGTPQEGARIEPVTAPPLPPILSAPPVAGPAAMQQLGAQGYAGYAPAQFAGYPPFAPPAYAASWIPPLRDGMPHWGGGVPYAHGPEHVDTQASATWPSGAWPAARGHGAAIPSPFPASPMQQPPRAPQPAWAWQASAFDAAHAQPLVSNTPVPIFSPAASLGAPLPPALPHVPLLPVQPAVRGVYTTAEQPQRAAITQQELLSVHAQLDEALAATRRSTQATHHHAQSGPATLYASLSPSAYGTHFPAARSPSVSAEAALSAKHAAESAIARARSAVQQTGEPLSTVFAQRLGSRGAPLVGESFAVYGDSDQDVPSSAGPSAQRSFFSSPPSRAAAPQPISASEGSEDDSDGDLADFSGFHGDARHEPGESY